MENKELEVNWCYDEPDERDYEYSDVFETAWAEIPPRYILDNVEYQNQWAQDITSHGCVYYSNWHASNEENFQEWSDVRIDNKDLVLVAIKKDMLDPTYWTKTSNWPKLLKILWYISGYTKVNTINEIKHSLLNKRPVAVWSRSLLWASALKPPYVVKWPSWPAHAVVIIGYDDHYEGWCFIIKNSYWDKKYDWGKLYLKYSDLWLLFPSKYSLIDEKDPILAYKKKIMEWITLESAKKFVERGYTNWKDPQKPISREELRATLERILEKNNLK